MKMMLKSVLKIIPDPFLRKFRFSLFLSMVSQLLDFSSIVFLVPVIIGLFNTDFLAHNLIFEKFHVSFPFEAYQAELIAAVVVFFIVKNFISVKITRYQSDFYYSLSNTLSTDLLQRFLDKDLLDVKEEKNSALMKDIIFIPNNFVIYVLSSVVQLASEAFLLLLILVACLLINPLASLCLLTIATTMMVCLYHYDRREITAANKNVSQQYDSNFNHLLNALNGFTEIKINQLETYFVKKFSDSNDALNKTYSDLTFARMVKPKYTETFLIVIVAVLFLFSKYFSTNPANSALFVSFLFASCIKIVPSVSRILIGLANFKSNAYTIDFLADQPDTKEKFTFPEKITFTKKITLHDISFSYPGSRIVLDHISLTIQKGKSIGIFGDSGNGKSTLINIIASLIHPDSGVISCDDIPLCPNHRPAYLSLLAYVPQSPFILEGSISENLSFGNKATTGAIDYYLKRFELYETIDAQPQKLTTFIGNNSHSLSGGQLQRLAIIRALLRNPEILILDEATNQLDSTLRYKTAGILKELSNEKGLTIITISHNKKELESFCDVVYELKDATLTPIS